MTSVQAGRFTTTPPPGSVIFIIGMRFNKLWKLHKWFPVFTAMPRMLRELEQQPELGLLHYRLVLSGRSPMVIQYWESVDKLNAYAKAPDHVHLPAWRAFNRSVGNDGDVGIFHETFVVGADSFEAVYGNMPEAMAGAAFGTVPVGRVGQTAARRMNLTPTDEPAVAPPA